MVGISFNYREKEVYWTRRMKFVKLERTIGHNNKGSEWVILYLIDTDATGANSPGRRSYISFIYLPSYLHSKHIKRQTVNDQAALIADPHIILSAIKVHPRAQILLKATTTIYYCTGKRSSARRRTRKPLHAEGI